MRLVALVVVCDAFTEGVQVAWLGVVATHFLDCSEMSCI
jgi:hypothetical protein